MSESENKDMSQPQYLEQIFCSVCGSQATFDTKSLGAFYDKHLVSIPVTCKECGYKWQIDLQLISSGVTTNTSIISSDKGQIDETSGKPVPYHDQQILVGQKGIFKNSKLAVIPLPLFWTMVVVLLVLVGTGGILWGQLQQKETEDAINNQREAALVIVRATTTAETRMTATQQALSNIATATSEMRTNIAANATVSKSETEVAATATAEWKATGTTESMAVINAQATATAEWKATGTTESMATINAQATGTAQWIATNTALRIATANAKATTTAEYVKTATAEKIVVENVKTTATAERKATVTAEKIATVNAETTVTVEWIRTATAQAGVPPTATVTPTPMPELNVLILGCDTGIDLSHRMGEVTNAWVTVQNAGRTEATSVQIVLSAQDEVSEHPDKSFYIQHLPAEYQITLKLTVDTVGGKDSNAKVLVTSDQGATAVASKLACKNLDENAKKLIEMTGDLGKIVLMKSIGQ